MNRSRHAILSLAGVSLGILLFKLSTGSGFSTSTLPVPMLITLGLCLLVQLAIGRQPRPLESRWGSRSLTLLLLLLLSAWALPLGYRPPAQSELDRLQTARLQNHFTVIQARWQELESVALSIADSILAAPLHSSDSMNQSSPDRLQWMEHVAQAVQQGSDRLPDSFPRPLVGAQLFDSSGQMLAWTGTTDIVRSGTRLSNLSGGAKRLYFKKIGTVTYLVYDYQEDRVSPVKPPRRATAPRLVVYLPVRVASFIPTLLLDVWDLQQTYSSDDIDVELKYARDEIPPYITQKEYELSGDAQRGYQIEGIVKTQTGGNILLALVTLPSLADSVIRSDQRIARTHNVLTLFASILLWIAVGFMWIAKSDALKRYLWQVPLYPILGMWLSRWVALQQDFGLNLFSENLVNPSFFASREMFGLLRSPLDLFLTMVTVFGSVFLWFVATLSNRKGNTEIPDHTRITPMREGFLQFGSLIAVSALMILGLISLRHLCAHATPQLATLQLDFRELPLLCIHAALLCWAASLLLIGVLVISGPVSGKSKYSKHILIVGALVSGLTLWFVFTPVLGCSVFAMLIAAPWMRSVLQDERFTSFTLACFAVVALATTLVVEAIHVETFESQQASIVARAKQARRLVDEERKFALGRFLHEIGRERASREPLPQTTSAILGGRAFELWEGSLLKTLGWPVQIRVFDGSEKLNSDFSTGMPYRRNIDSRELRRRAGRTGYLVEQTVVETRSRGPVNLYRGAVAISVNSNREDMVVVELPFGQEDLSSLGEFSRSSHGSMNTVGDENRLLRYPQNNHSMSARLEAGVVVESTSPYLELGQRLPGFDEIQSTWQRVEMLEGTYIVRRIGFSGQVRVVGLQVKSVLVRMLEWAQVGSFYFTLVLGALFGLGILGRLVGPNFPLLLIPKRIGFQQKLMVAFLVVALAPSFILAFTTRNTIRERSTRRNRDAALVTVRSAEAALSSLVGRELESFRNSEFIRDVLNINESLKEVFRTIDSLRDELRTGESLGEQLQATEDLRQELKASESLRDELEKRRELSIRDIGEFGASRIMLYGSGRMIRDETLANLSPEEARRFFNAPPGLMNATVLGPRGLSLGMTQPVWYSKAEKKITDAQIDSELFYLYYQRFLEDGVLQDLAPILNTDVSIFVGNKIQASSRRNLALAGLLPSLVPPKIFQDLMIRGKRVVVTEESRGDNNFAGYLPLHDRDGKRIGVLAVSQLFRPDEFAQEFERTRTFVIGLSTLMFLLTLILGVVFTSYIFDPVRNLIEGTRRLAGGEFGFRLRQRSTDEIGELERSFNIMVQRVEKAQTDLEDRRRYLEAVLGNINSGVVASDATGCITTANAAAKQILGVQANELEGQIWKDLTQGGGSSGSLRTFWQQVGQATDGEIFETPFKRDGDILTLRVIVTDLQPRISLEMETGEWVAQESASESAERTLGRVAIFEDVTQLIRSKKLSAWAEMARQVAHEIKNPLTPLKAEAQFMEQAFRDESKDFPQIFKDGMQTIIQQVDTLRRIASEFSSFGRVQKLQPQPVDLMLILRRVAMPYRNMEGLEFALNGPVDAEHFFDTTQALPDLKVLGDTDGLSKVFRNILENAREAMNGQGEISLHIADASEGKVTISVHDQGDGIDAEIQERLYEPYFSTKSNGTGLGLAITRGILDEIGASIRIENGPQGGAIAKVTLIRC